MTALERTIRVLISRIETRLWESSTSSDILAVNGDIIGSRVSGHYHVYTDSEGKKGFISFTLEDYESDAIPSPEMSIVLTDCTDLELAMGIKIIFKKDRYYPISDMDIASVSIIGEPDVVSLEDLSAEVAKKAENMIMFLSIMLCYNR